MVPVNIAGIKCALLLSLYREVMVTESSFDIKCACKNCYVGLNAMIRCQLFTCTQLYC
jgi:hypothetical protein